MSRPRSVRSALVTITVVVAALTAIVSGALVVLTTMLHRTTISSATSVESVRLAQAAEIDLLLHERAVDPLVRGELEGDLRRRILDAKRFVTTSPERAQYERARSAVDAYLAASGSARPESGVVLHDAYEALERLVNINLKQSEEARDRAARWDRIANGIGIGVGLLVVAVASALLIWLLGHAFAPILDLADALARFGRGDHSARAAEQGPRELRDICRSFNEMADALAAQRQAQMAFLGGVAHDLRNPLGALGASAALLESQLGGDARVRAILQRIGRQVGRMDRMLGDFLDAAAIEAGRVELRLVEHDLRSSTLEVIHLFEGSAEQRLQTRLPTESVDVRCDPTRIQQVVANLISNAFKYSSPETVVQVSLQRRGHEAEIAVSDRGIGIAGPDRARVFEPFRRVGLSRESVPGVGLGLFVVRKIVEAHGGRIELDSTAGRGSTFRVLLPLSTEPLAR